MTLSEFNERYAGNAKRIFEVHPTSMYSPRFDPVYTVTQEEAERIADGMDDELRCGYHPGVQEILVWPSKEDYDAYMKNLAEVAGAEGIVTETMARVTPPRPNL